MRSRKCAGSATSKSSRPVDQTNSRSSNRQKLEAEFEEMRTTLFFACRGEMFVVVFLLEKRARRTATWRFRGGAVGVLSVDGREIMSSFDLAIIGGGVNGCGIARDAAGRGWSVFLCEKGDLASATSSASTKLIHGGLRYLEYFQFRLVREALLEREVLWGIAPHIVWPLRFVLPHHQKLRPAWLLRLGLFIYDHLGGRKRLPSTRTLDLQRDPAGALLKP